MLAPWKTLYLKDWQCHLAGKANKIHSNHFHVKSLMLLLKHRDIPQTISLTPLHSFILVPWLSMCRLIYVHCECLVVLNMTSGGCDQHAAYIRGRRQPKPGPGEWGMRETRSRSNSYIGVRAESNSCQEQEQTRSTITRKQEIQGAKVVTSITPR